MWIGRNLLQRSFRISPDLSPSRSDDDDYSHDLVVRRFSAHTNVKRTMREYPVEYSAARQKNGRTFIENAVPKEGKCMENIYTSILGEGSSVCWSDI
jgi:hypothetical protein